jgi:hypothetical protein
MTTTVTIKTHDWPVKVTTVDRYSLEHRSLEAQGQIDRVVHTEATTIETVPPHSAREFHITDSRSIAFDELPRPDVD